MTLKLNGSSSGYTAIDAPAAAGSNTLVLPADNGSNGEFLKTNGSGTLDWAQAGGGKILQVVMGTLKASFLSNSATMTDTGLGATITPASTSNKILVQVNFGMVCTTTSRAAGFHLYRDGSAVTDAQGTSGTTEDYTMFAYIQNANEVTQHSFSYLDSPSSTSALAYKMYVARVMSDANAISLNRLVTTDAYGCLSTMILMEVEG